MVSITKSFARNAIKVIDQTIVKKMNPEAVPYLSKSGFEWAKIEYYNHVDSPIRTHDHDDTAGTSVTFDVQMFEKRSKEQIIQHTETVNSIVLALNEGKKSLEKDLLIAELKDENDSLKKEIEKLKKQLIKSDQDRLEDWNKGMETLKIFKKDSDEAEESQKKELKVQKEASELILKESKNEIEELKRKVLKYKKIAVQAQSVAKEAHVSSIEKRKTIDDLNAVLSRYEKESLETSDRVSRIVESVTTPLQISFYDAGLGDFPSDDARLNNFVKDVVLKKRDRPMTEEEKEAALQMVVERINSGKLERKNAVIYKRRLSQ